MDLYCRVTAQGLVPLYDSDLAARRRLREGSTVKVTVHQPRNYRFHKKFFALVRLAFDNLPESLAESLCVHSEDDMLKCIKQDLSLFSVTRVGGREAIEYHSISFSAMDNTEFERFYRCVIDLVRYKYLRGVSRQDILDEIDNFR